MDGWFEALREEVKVWALDIFFTVSALISRGLIELQRSIMMGQTLNSAIKRQGMYRQHRCCHVYDWCFEIAAS